MDTKAEVHDSVEGYKEEENTTKVLNGAEDPYRAAEKKYKLPQLPRRLAKRQKLPETDFTDVVDFHNLDNNTEQNKSMIHQVTIEDKNILCYTFSGVPGLLIFPNIVSEEDQISLTREAILEYGDSSQHPNILSTHAKEPRETTCYQPPMRWSTLGFSYQWTSKRYHRDAYSSFPERVKNLMIRLIKVVSLVNQDQFSCELADSYQPQTAIVNFYPVGSMMVAHQDLSEEVMNQPLVSLSLGCSTIFLMGTENRSDAPYAFLLKSGDVAAFAGPSRVAYHSIPRMLDDCPSYLTLPDEDLSDLERNSYENFAYYYQNSAQNDSKGTSTSTSNPNPNCNNDDNGSTFTSNMTTKNLYNPKQPFSAQPWQLVDKSKLTEAEKERYWRLCMRHLRININARQVYQDACPFLYKT